MATAFSIASILSISNFLQILFSTDAQTVANPSRLEQFLNDIYLYFIRFGKTNALWIFAGIVFGIYFLKDIFTYGASYFAASTRYKVIRNIRRDLFRQYTTQHISFMDSYKKGDLLSRISTDATEYDQNVLQGLQSLVSVIINVVLYFGILLYLNPLLTLTALVVVPLVGGAVSLISRKLRKASRKMQTESAELISKLEESISGLRIIKSHTAIEFMNKGFSEFNNAYTRLRTSIYRRVDLASPQSEFFGNCMVIGILLLGTSQIISLPPKMSAEMFIVYLIIFSLIIKPAKDFTTSLYNIRKGKASEDRMMEILLAENKSENMETERKIEKKIKAIRIKGVSFAYSQTPILQCINIPIRKGEPLAIVGPSGAGKSTLIDLLMKFRTPSEGEIYFNRVPISKLSENEVRRHIAVVSQDTILFNDTVANNLAFANPDCSIEDIKAAAKAAKADEFIEKLEKGYDTIIGEGGCTLSGGQKQRLAIARAILRNADILILDEATASLDTISERYIQEAIDAISKDRIIITIAHRISTIRHYPHIVVMNQGEIQAIGIHEKLIHRNELYASLCRLQNIEPEPVKTSTPTLVEKQENKEEVSQTATKETTDSEESTSSTAEETQTNTAETPTATAEDHKVD